jgi:hypothetical protein
MIPDELLIVVEYIALWWNPDGKTQEIRSTKYFTSESSADNYIKSLERKGWKLLNRDTYVKIR